MFFVGALLMDALTYTYGTDSARNVANNYTTNIKVLACTVKVNKLTTDDCNKNYDTMREKINTKCYKPLNWKNHWIARGQFVAWIGERQGTTAATAEVKNRWSIWTSHKDSVLWLSADAFWRNDSNL